MRNRGFIVLILVCTLLLSYTYADPNQPWKGHGLFLLSGSSISSEKGEVDMIFSQDTILYSSSYTLKNSGSKEAFIAVGMPTEGVKRFAAYEGAKPLKPKQSKLSNVLNNYKLGENAIPNEKLWYVFNINLKANESKVVTIKAEMNLRANEQDWYFVVLPSNLQYNARINPFSLSTSIQIKEYNPFFIDEIKGFEANALDFVNGKAKLLFKDGQGEDISLSYRVLEKELIGALESSGSKKQKLIAQSYKAKDFTKVINLCNEYINDTANDGSNINFVKFFLAHNYIKQGQYNEYIKVAESIDVGAIPIEDAGFKLIFDKLKAYEATKSMERLNQLIHENKDYIDNNELAINWLQSKGIAARQEELLPADEPEEPQLDRKAAAFTLNLKKYQDAVLGFKYMGYLIYFGVFLLGFILGRMTKRQKRYSSVYLYRK